MADEIADELIQNCITATREGLDFPAVWQNLAEATLSRCRPPIQGIESGRVFLKIPLVGNRWLVFDSTSKEFSLLPQ
jgi:hypothetical protein